MGFCDAIQVIITVGVFLICYFTFHKIAENADAWIKRNTNESVYGKICVVAMVICILVTKTSHT